MFEWLLDVAAWSQAAIAFGYLGIFLVSFIGTITIFLPLPSFAVIFAAGAVFNPWAVGIIAGIGAGIGEVTGYAVGRGSRELIKKKYARHLKRAKAWTRKRGVFPVIIFFAATPLPTDVIGILAGVIHYDIKKFLFASIIGKIIQSLVLAWAGFYSLEIILPLFGFT